MCLMWASLKFRHTWWSIPMDFSSSFCSPDQHPRLGKGWSRWQGKETPASGVCDHPDHHWAPCTHFHMLPQTISTFPVFPPLTFLLWRHLISALPSSSPASQGKLALGLNLKIIVVESLPHLTLCDPMDFLSFPGFPVLHHLQEFAQAHVHCVGDAIQLSRLLSLPSHPALHLSQNQGLFQWVSSSHQVAKVLELQL